MLNKVVHCTYLEKNISSISSHCEEEKITAIEHNLPWDVYLHISVERIETTNKLNLFIDRLKYYAQVFKFTRQYRFVLLRYIPADPFFALLLLTSGKKICTIHHTKEDVEILNSHSISLKNIVKFVIEFIFGPISRTHVHTLISKTNEIGLYQTKQSIGKKKSDYVIYPNAGRYSKVVEDKRSKKPTFLFVSSTLNQPWQGVDVMLELFKNYQGVYSLHIVGFADESLKQEILSNHQIKYHGSLSIEEIRSLSFKCDIGLSCFAMYRSNLTEASSLKVRDYLSFGLPVYLTYKDIFPNNFKFCRYGESDINQIMEYAKTSKKWSKSEVMKSSEPYISRKKIMVQVLNQLNILS